MSVILRPARPDDAAALARILVEARTSAAVPNLHTPAEDVAFLGRLISAMPVIVAELESGAAGFAAVQDGWLEQFYVAPEHHRRGIGRALLAWARAESPGDLRLYVFAHNAGAVAFYRAHGAVQIAAGDGSGNEERLPDLTLLLRKA